MQQTNLRMKKFYTQKRLFTTVDKQLLRQLERYVNKSIPPLLMLNLEKNNPNPLGDYITVTLHRPYYGDFLRTINDYEHDYFEDDVQKISFDLAHDNRFNFFGHKTIVIIINFDRVSNYCHFSVAINDEDGKNKVAIIERDIMAILQRNAKPATALKEMDSMLID